MFELNSRNQEIVSGIKIGLGKNRSDPLFVLTNHRAEWYEITVNNYIFFYIFAFINHASSFIITLTIASNRQNAELKIYSN